MKILLTPKQIMAIYDAGRERGRDEEYGTRWSRGPYFGPLKNSMVWTGKASILPDINAMGIDFIETWWNAFEEEASKDDDV